MAIIKHKVRVGLYTTGLKAYWPQFVGMRERLEGPVTTLGITQTRDGKLKFIVSEGEATDDPIMAIGNTQTHVRLAADPDTWYERWLMEAPTHHFAMSVGHNAAVFRKAADLLDIPFSMV